jgi:hypothetical protein
VTDDPPDWLPQTDTQTANPIFGYRHHWITHTLPDRRTRTLARACLARRVLPVWVGLEEGRGDTPVTLLADTLDAIEEVAATRPDDLDTDPRVRYPVSGQMYAEGQERRLETVGELLAYNCHQAVAAVAHESQAPRCAYLAHYARVAITRVESREMEFQSRLLTLFGPDPPSLGKWQNPTTRGLAETIYQQKAWHELPVLADALEEAGCDHPWLLRLLRTDWHHAHRGMFFLDALTGRR